MITEEAIKRIQETYHKFETIRLGDRIWEIYPEGMDFKEIVPHTINPLRISTLSGLVKFFERIPEDGLKDYCIHIKGIGEVRVIGEADETYRIREYFIEAHGPSQWPEQDRYIDIEQFIVYLMANFDGNDTLKELLVFLGSIKTEDVLLTDDDGVSQKVTVKSGITTVAPATVPNPLLLQPFISFPEITPPEQLYIFRMKKGGDMGPLCSLTTTASPIADLEIIERIRLYLSTRVEVDIIS